MSLWGRVFDTLYDRATSAAIVRSGLALRDERREHLPKAPAILQPLAIGRATR